MRIGEMRLGKMRRHPSYTYLQSATKMVQKKWWTSKQSLSKRQKNDKASRCCWSTYQKKIRRIGIKRNEIRWNEIRRNATQPCCV